MIWREQVVITLCLLLMLTPIQLKGAEVQQLGLVQYLEAVLKNHDVMFDLEESMADAQMNIDIEKHQFSPRLVPVSNIGLLKGAGTQSLGLKVKKNTELGTTVTVGVDVSRSESNDFVIANSHSVKSYIQISQGLFRRWGKDYNLIGLTRSQLQFKRQALSSKVRIKKILTDSVSQYYNVVLAKKMISNTKQLLKKSKGRLEEVKIRYDTGLSSKFDVTRAELSVMNAEYGLEDWKVTWRRALEMLTSSFVQGENIIFSVDSEIKLMAPLIPQDWGILLPTQKSEWKMYLIDKEMAVLSRDKAKRNMSPDVSLNVTLSESGYGNDFASASNLNQSDWAVQLSYNGGFDLFREEKELNKKEVKLIRLERKGELLKRAIHRKAVNAFENFSAEERRYKASLANVDLLEKLLELANIRYKHELSSLSDVIDAESAYVEAESTVIRARISYNIKAVKLAYALGIWDLKWLRMSEKTIGGI